MSAKHAMVALVGALAVATAVGCSDDTSATGAGGAGGTTTNGPTSGPSTGGGGQNAGGGGHGGSMMGGPFTSQGDSSYETQTSLAADGNGGIVVAWIAFFADDTSSIGYAVSRDGGSAWTAPQYVASPDGRLASNPVVAVDSQGKFALTWLGFRVQGNTDEHVYLSLLEAGDTFGAPAVASDDGTSTTLDFDKPSLTVDAADEWLVTWADFSGALANLTFARSSDGKAFTRTTLAADGTFGNLAHVCFDRSLGASAPLYMVHLSAGATLTVHRSNDGGANWAPLTVPAVDVLFQDPTCVVDGSDLWIGYAAGIGFDPFNDTPAETVRVIHSANGGDTMDAPVTASDSSGDTFLFPRLLRTANGKLALVYYQGTVDQPVELVVASSSDGTTWTTSSIAAAGTMAVDRTLANWLGAYVGFAQGPTNLLVSYTDNADVKDQIAFTSFASP